MTPVAESVWVVTNRETAERWSRALQDAGWPAHPLPWGRPVPEPGAEHAAREALAQADLVLLTSRHATAFLPVQAARGSSAACVGAGTAAAAERAGFDVQLVGREGGRALAERVVRERPAVKRVLWLRGVDVRREGPAVLRSHGVDVVEVVTYRVAPDDDLAQRLGQAPHPRAVAVGSPRAVDALLEAAETALLETLRQVPFIVMGGVTAGHVEERLGARAMIAPRTNPQGLVLAMSALAVSEGDEEG